jgi:predicted metal-dependent hydrolase
MAVKAEFKVEGVKELQRRLYERKEAMKRVLDMKLQQLAEEAVSHAKHNKGYRDRTANLKNSISYALFFDGELVTQQIGTIPKPDEAPKGHQAVESNLDTFCQQEGVVRPKGYSLVVVAGMEYGAHVEHKGYNVLHLTKYFLRDEMKKILEETLEEIK